MIDKQKSFPGSLYPYELMDGRQETKLLRKKADQPNLLKCFRIFSC